MNMENTLDRKNAPFDESRLFEQVSAIIEDRKFQAESRANAQANLMFWEVGQYIRGAILDFKRADYGKRIFSTLSRKLVERYGNTFQRENLYRMVQFSEVFSDLSVLEELVGILSWSHFCELIRIKNAEARIFYARDSVARRLGIRELRRQISRKAYERQEVANSQLTNLSTIPFNVFKDPYLLDILGMKGNFLEADLERAILAELENFILEFGNGFAFVARQKRMTMDGDDFTLDMLFFHRLLRRLVAVELKLGKFKPQFKGQMEFYLRWLNKFERNPDENAPIGIILCTEASRNQIELMEMDKAGIAVAEYWTALPPKGEFERKIQELLYEAQERLERRKLLIGKGHKRVDYYIDSVGDDDE